MPPSEAGSNGASPDRTSTPSTSAGTPPGTPLPLDDQRFPFHLPAVPDVQSIAAELRGKENSLWVFQDPEVEARWRALIQEGYRALRSAPPNLLAAAKIRDRVESAIKNRLETRRMNLQWQARTAVSLAFVVAVLMFLGWAVEKEMNVVRIPVWALLLGAAGGAISGLVSLRDPISILSHRQSVVFNAVSRPLVGVLTGSLAFGFVVSGLINLPQSPDSLLLRAIIVLIAGYNERLLGGLTSRAELLLAASRPNPSQED